MTNTTTVANDLSMPPNNTVTNTNNLNQSNTINCGLNQQVESSFTHQLHQPLHSTNLQTASQTHYQSSIVLPTALNASSTFYSPHFTMHASQFSPITSTNPVVAVSSSFGGINQSTSTIYGKVPSLSNNSFCNGDDNNNSSTNVTNNVTFMEPQHSILGL